MIHDSFMSRPNIIVCPGGKMGLAIQIIFTPMILHLMDKKAPRALTRQEEAAASCGAATSR